MSSNILIERRDQEQVILRAKYDDRKLASALKAAGLKKPKAGRKEGGAHWFSTDEMLLFVDNAKAVVPKMKKKLPAHSLVHDATGARVVFKLSGPHLRDVFAKGAPRDLRLVAHGEVVRTRLGQVAVAFWFHADDEAELVCFRSVADYVEKWLEVAALEDGLPVMG